MQSIQTLALTTLVALASLARSATAQTSSFDAPQTGARIRMSVAGGASRTGTVLARSSESIVVGLANGASDTVAMHDVTKLEISSGGKAHVGRGALIGLGVGGVLGVIGKASTSDTGNDVRDQACTKTDVATCLLGAISGSSVSATSWVMIPAGMLAGAAVGALLGRHRSEQWREVTTGAASARVGLVPTTRARGLALVVSTRF